MCSCLNRSAPEIHYSMLLGRSATNPQPANNYSTRQLQHNTCSRSRGTGRRGWECGRWDGETGSGGGGGGGGEAFVCFFWLLKISAAGKVCPMNQSPEMLLLFVGCLTSQQHASVSQGRICTDNFTCCHTETEVADQTFHLTQSQYTDTGPTSPNADPITPGAWQGSHWSANF